jgi:hypothetical protein
MGVTIHYAGCVRSATDVEDVVLFAEHLALRKGWPFERLTDGIDSPLEGFVAYPHPDCESLRFKFDRRNKFSGWVKTQFAGAETHMQVVDFLRQMRPHLRLLGVRDEGEYWATGSGETLRWHIDTINRLIQEAFEKNPNIRIKVKTDGLVIDYIE